MHLWNRKSGEKEDGRFEIPQSAIARYFLIQFESGITKIQLSTAGLRPREINGATVVECTQATITYSFNNDVQVNPSLPQEVDARS